MPAVQPVKATPNKNAGSRIGTQRKQPTPPTMAVHPMIEMLSGLGDAGPVAPEAKAAFVDFALNWMSHQTAIANGIPNISAMLLRKVCLVPAVISGGMRTTIVASRVRADHAPRKPAKIRMDVRAQERRRKTPIAVQIPRAASAAVIAAAAIAIWVP